LGEKKVVGDGDDDDEVEQAQGMVALFYLTTVYTRTLGRCEGSAATFVLPRQWWRGGSMKRDADWALTPGLASDQTAGCQREAVSGSISNCVQSPQAKACFNTSLASANECCVADLARSTFLLAEASVVLERGSRG